MAERTRTVTFESPPTSHPPISRWRRLFNRLLPLITWNNKGTSSGPCQQRMVHGEDEEQGLQYSNTHCFSSYYSVFVARLAIMLFAVMRNVTWALFASRKALNSITISYRNGFVQAFHRDHKSNNTFYIYSDLANSSITGKQEFGPLASNLGWQDKPSDSNVSAIWFQEPLDPVTGEKTGVARQIPPDDLINIAGLSELRDGAASWHVAVSKFTDSPLLSAALPVRSPSDGGIIAVVGVTTALFSVGQLMKELVEYHSGYMYLTSQEGYVLATSTDSPLLKNSTSGPKLLMAVDSEDRMIRSGAKWLQREYGNNSSINHEVHAENVMLGHQRYYIDSFFLNLKRLPLTPIQRKALYSYSKIRKINEKKSDRLEMLLAASHGRRQSLVKAGDGLVGFDKD
ncbi:histidine kinase 1-like protein [Cinnamomum micranthum f. kanehirae]|uniref:histidine kinase n=1 Tax=Cinnamomum micranthum f. kanehirae TaxID=337451 RepID=A0A3S3P397_9MAGN|nr:histidine kinase 1-like protein [Cinnamomum micranthum f. kanehirae]